MTTPAIGGQTFREMMGGIQPASAQFELMGRPGVDGVALRQRERRGREFTQRTITGLAGANNADTQMATYQGLKGSTVSVTDVHGNTYSNMIVLDVELVGVRAVLLDTLGDAALMICVWTLISNDV